MKITGLMLARNEDWVIGFSLRAALMWVDEMVVLLHNCTDRTEEVVNEVADEHPGLVHVAKQDTEGTGWPEMKLREAMLLKARAEGAEGIVVIDADEVLSGNLLHDARSFIERAPRNHIIFLPHIQPWGGMERWRTDGIFGKNWIRGWAWNGDKGTWLPNRPHHARKPQGVGGPPAVKPVPNSWSGGVLHLRAVNLRRVKVKSDWYKLYEALHIRPGAMRKNAKARGQELQRRYDKPFVRKPVTEKMPESWTYPYDHLLPHLDMTAVPEWQVSEIKTMVRRIPKCRRQFLKLRTVQ